MYKLVRNVAFTALTIGVVALVLVPLAVGQSAPPSALHGHVYVNGVATNGIAVSCGGKSWTTCNDAGGNAGYYQFAVVNGSSCTVSATYNGHTASQPVNVNVLDVVADLHIDYSASTPTATANPTSNGGGSYTYNNGAIGQATVTVTPTVTATPTANATITPTPTATPTPTPGPTEQPQQTGFPLWLLLILIAILVIGAAAYLLWRRK